MLQGKRDRVEEKVGKSRQSRMTNVAFLIPAKRIGIILRRCQNTTIGPWVACQAWSEAPPQDPPPKTPPIIVSKIAIAHSSLGRLRAARPPARSPARSPSRTPSQKVRQRGGRRLQTARRRSLTRTPPSRRVPERSNPALEQFLIDHELNEKATQVLRQAAPEVQEQLL